MSDKTYQPGVYRAQDSAGFFDENIIASATSSISNYGYHVVGTTKVITLAAPVLGAIKSIQFNSTKTQQITCGGGAYINQSGDVNLLIKATSAGGGSLGCCIKLVGGSTAAWYIMGIGQGSTATSTITAWNVKLST